MEEGLENNKDLFPWERGSLRLSTKRKHGGGKKSTKPGPGASYRESEGTTPEHRTYQTGRGGEKQQGEKESIPSTEEGEVVRGDGSLEIDK